MTKFVDMLRTNALFYVKNAVGFAATLFFLSGTIACCEKMRVYREELNSLQIANAKANCTYELVWHADHYAIKFFNDATGKVVYIYDAEKHATITKADYEKAFEASSIAGCARVEQ